ncbi:hypothetical protein F4212_03745 [Candidatus Poribacteria bacterium]|nr:hypothetical protein [Candidatus Poribacteria bacterium]
MTVRGATHRPSSNLRLLNPPTIISRNYGYELSDRNYSIMHHVNIPNSVSNYEIEVVGVETCSMNSKAADEVREIASRFATNIKVGENEEHIFKTYASQLERFFRAKISTYNQPTNTIDHYRLNLPLHGYFDDSPERFSILFRITRVRDTST